MIKLELKKLKVSRSLSEETLAFTADVWLAGKKVGTASERGNGGQVHFRDDGPDVRATVASYVAELRTMPPKLYGKDLPMDIQPRTIEDAINTLAWDMDTAKYVRSKLTRLLKTHTLFLTPEKVVRQFKAIGPKVDESIAQKYPGSTILNALSLDDAVAVAADYM